MLSPSAYGRLAAVRIQPFSRKHGFGKILLQLLQTH
jgi:hypothetical protein